MGKQTMNEDDDAIHNRHTDREEDGADSGRPLVDGIVEGEDSVTPQQGESTDEAKSPGSPDTPQNQTPPSQLAAQVQSLPKKGLTKPSPKPSSSGATNAEAKVSSGVNRGLDRTQEELDAKRNTKNNKSIVVATPAPTKDGVNRGLDRTQEELDAKRNARNNRSIVVATPAPTKGGVNRGLDRTQEELESKRNARNNRSIVVATQAPTKEFGRGLDRTQEEREAKLSKRLGNAASAPLPNSSRGTPKVKLGLQRHPLLNPTHQQPHAPVADPVALLHSSSEPGGDEDSLHEVDVDSYQITMDTSRPHSTTSMDVSVQQPNQGQVLSTQNGSNSSISTNIQEVDVASHLIDLEANRLPSSTALAVAQQLDDASDGSLALAVEVDPAELEFKAFEKKKRDERRMVGFVFVVISLAGIAGFVYGLKT